MTLLPPVALFSGPQFHWDSSPLSYTLTSSAHSKQREPSPTASMTMARGRPGARPLLAASRALQGVSVADEKLPSSPRPAGGKAASACCSLLGTPTPASTARSEVLDSARPRMLGMPGPRAQAVCPPCSLKTPQTHNGSAYRSGWRPRNYFCGQHLPGSSHPKIRTPYLVHENT